MNMRDLPPTAACPATPCEEWAGEVDGAVLLRASPRLRRLMAEKRIFFGRDGNALGDGDVLALDRRARIEPYACFAAGLQPCTLGAFSIVESALPPDTQVGRYSTIADGVTVFGDRLPMEWACMSPLGYDAGTWRSCAAARQDFGLAGEHVVRPHKLREPAPRIGHDVWIGQHARLARGITIGHGAVVAAGAVVTRDVPPYSVAAGTPARPVRLRFPEALVQQLLQSRWWEFDASVLDTCGYREPWRFVRAVAALAPAERWHPQALAAQDLLDELAGNAEATGAREQHQADGIDE